MLRSETEKLYSFECSHLSQTTLKVGIELNVYPTTSVLSATDDLPFMDATELTPEKEIEITGFHLRHRSNRKALKATQKQQLN